MFRRIAIVVVVLLVALLAWNYLRPIPAVAATASLPAQYAVAGTPPAIPWPLGGSAAVGVSGLGLIASSGNEQPVPAASVAKVMTAYLVLFDRPLNKGEDGPAIPITDADVQTYLVDKADHQSVVEVQVGERLTEFQALEALLIPSANNIADMLARWDAGAVDTFVGKMNDSAKKLGLTHTVFADASGVSVKTVSTPTDLLSMGMVAMQKEVLAQIVNLPQADLPVVGITYNVDYVLGQSGIIGIKTGSGVTPGGANFLFAASTVIDKHPVTLYGCVMGQPTLDYAFNAAKALIAALEAGLHVRPVIARNDTVATFNTPWGTSSDLLATVDVTLVEWPGMMLQQRLAVPSIVIDQPLAAGTAEGTLHVLLGDYKLDVPLVMASPLYPPGRLWRLTRITNI